MLQVEPGEGRLVPVHLHRHQCSPLSAQISFHLLLDIQYSSKIINTRIYTKKYIFKLFVQTTIDHQIFTYIVGTLVFPH
jgi:hypothetical protein